ncbi:MAG: RNA polymerase sigma factor SigJ [bacterium]|nr:MAG: RNA polymerase sigma factor SigJ [bacterium]
MNSVTESRELEQYRRLMIGLAYRIVGSVAEAEDIVQEAFIKWIHVDKDTIQSPKSWLFTVTTRLALDYLKSAKVKREFYIGPWLPEPYIHDNRSPDSIYEIDESISMALMVVLERLTLLERGSYILHDIFKFQYTEIADILNQSIVNCRQLVSRARKRIKINKSSYSPNQQEYLELTHAFFDALKNGDMDRLIAVLSDKVTLHADGGGKVTAAEDIINGVQEVAAFLMKKISRPLNGKGADVKGIWFNGSPGVVLSFKLRPVTAFNFQIESNKIIKIHAVRNPDKLTRFS